MKLAEALQERADLNKSIANLRWRLEEVMLVQEGVEPKGTEANEGAFALRSRKIERMPNGQPSGYSGAKLAYVTEISHKAKEE